MAGRKAGWYNTRLEEAGRLGWNLATLDARSERMARLYLGICRQRGDDLTTLQQIKGTRMNAEYLDKAVLLGAHLGFSTFETIYILLHEGGSTHHGIQLNQMAGDSAWRKLKEFKHRRDQAYAGEVTALRAQRILFANLTEHTARPPADVLETPGTRFDELFAWYMLTKLTGESSERHRVRAERRCQLSWVREAAADTLPGWKDIEPLLRLQTDPTVEDS